MMRQMLDHLNGFLEEAVAHYEKSAPAVSDYLDGLYVRSREDADNVALSELLAVAGLKEDGQWEQPNYAANRVYHLLHRLGRDTTGLAGS